jgi:tRNA(adenine34) deaminase
MKYISDEDKMRVALNEAKKAHDVDEVPIGAAMFDKDDNLICANHNRRELDQNPTSHAEILVLEEASQILGTWRLEDTTIAVTLEPDAMCAGAIVNARVSKLIYGAPNLKAGAAYSLYNIPQDPRLNHHVEIKDNILSHESEAILSSFFDSKR